MKEKICIIDQGKVAGHLRYVRSELAIVQAALDYELQQMDELEWAAYTSNLRYECARQIGGSATIVDGLKSAKMNEADVGPALTLASEVYEAAQARCDSITASIAAINARFSEP